jgi:hypothetical protein
MKQGMEKTHMKFQLSWADKLYGLLMQQAVNEENVGWASSAVGAWLGEKSSAMSKEDFEKLLEQAVEELTTYAWDTNAPCAREWHHEGSGTAQP